MADIAQNVDDERELMHELVSWKPFANSKSLDHPAGNPFPYPYIAIQYPDDITPGLAIGPAHVPNLRVRPKARRLNISPQDRILLFHQYPRIEMRVIGHYPLEDGIRWVMLRSHAEAYGQSRRRVGLSKRGSQAFVEMRFDTLDRADDGNMRER